MTATKKKNRSPNKIPFKYIEQLEETKDHLQRLIDPDSGDMEGNGVSLMKGFGGFKNKTEEYKARRLVGRYIDAWVLWRLDQVIEYGKGISK